MSTPTMGFAEACYDQNTLSELENALVPDETDMTVWGITANEWTEAIQIALYARENDITIEDALRILQ